MIFSNILEIIFLATSLFSLFGAIVILCRKSPVLAEIPEERVNSANSRNIFLALLKNIGNIPFLKNFSFELFLHKILSRIRILILRTDSKTSVWLQQLRERAKKKKMAEIDTYWQELRKLTTRRKKTNLPG